MKTIAAVIAAIALFISGASYAGSHHKNIGTTWIPAYTCAESSHVMTIIDTGLSAGTVTAANTALNSQISSGNCRFNTQREPTTILSVNRVNELQLGNQLYDILLVKVRFHWTGKVKWTVVGEKATSV